MKNRIKGFVHSILIQKKDQFFFKQNGFCPCCENQVYFIAENSWLRDHFKCSKCDCIPRERALMLIIERQYPNWKELKIHESSPGNRGHSIRLKKQARHYIASQYFPDHEFGATVDGFRNEDLENQTFTDENFDLVITSDVMEHIYNPQKAFKEIHRTLKPGGAHIFSVPLVNKHKPTQRWALKKDDGSPKFLYTPEYHGNPVDRKGSPVTMHWGFDIKEFITECTGADSEIVHLDELKYGIRAEYIEIVIARKKT